MATIDLGRVKQVFRGNWSASDTYVVDDVVQHGNSLWVCVLNYIPDSTESYAPGYKTKGYKEMPTFDPVRDPHNPNPNLLAYRPSIKTYHVAYNGVDDQFIIDGHQLNNQITLQTFRTYRFTQVEDSNNGKPIQFSTIADGNHNSGTHYDGSTYWLDDQEVDEATYVASFSNWNNHGYRAVEITVENDLTVLYPYTVGTASTYGSASIGIEKSWRGWCYWESLGDTINLNGEWNSTTQYKYNDLVTYQSGTYRALRDTIGRAPHTGGLARTPIGGTNTKNWFNDWEQIIGGGVTNEEAGAWFPNAGPLGWPYAHGKSDRSNIYRNKKFISRTGTVYTIGSGTNGDGATGDGQPICFFQEVPFKWREWDSSEDRACQEGLNPANSAPRTGKKWTRTNRPPRCIQIEQGYGWSLYLFDNGEVKHSGYGQHGQNGNGRSSDWNEPMSINGLEGVRIIKICSNVTQANNTHTCAALDEDGNVWMWGYNGYGQCATGRTENVTAATKINRGWFDNYRIIDITAAGNGESAFFARTTDDNVYGWGRNNSGWLGQNDTTDRYRPVKLQGWDPVTNNGIAQWQASGYSSSGSFMILDGNGFVHHVGYNGYGNSLGSDTNNHTIVTKSVSIPNGDIEQIWCFGWNGYQTTFARHTDGRLFVSGHSGGSYLGGTGVTGTITPPAVVDKFDDVVDVQLCGDYSDVASVFFLRSNGEMFCQGYDSYNTMPNWYAGTNWTGEDGTYKPFHANIPAGDKIVAMNIVGTWQSTNYYGLIPTLMTEKGQVFGWGFSHGTSSTDGQMGGLGNQQGNATGNASGGMVNITIGR
jgi:hypothetical protein